MTGSGTRVSRSIVQRAEALLRSLIGVSRAEVHVRASGGVERVRLVADGGLSNGQIVQNVRSALLAGLGVVLQPGQIEFVDEASWEPARPPLGSEAEAAASGASVQPPREAHDSAVATPPESNPGNEIAGVVEPRNGKGRGDGPPRPHASPVNGNGLRAGRDVYKNGKSNGSERLHGSATPRDSTSPDREVAAPPANGLRADRSPEIPGLGRTGRRARGSGSARARTSEPPPGRAEIPADTPLRGEATIGSRRVRLERVEVLRQGGRLRCRVVLSAGGDRYSAIADCAEQPLAELQLAGRVTCDALRAGDLTQSHFEAATVANLAGGMHVLVALNGWNRGEPVRRSGSAVIRESAEHAAALAVLNALANT